MIRTRENPVMWQAGALSLLVHGLFFLILVMTFSWKNVQPMQVAQVELWDKLPTPKIAPPPEPPKPEPKVEPPPQPKPEPPPEPPEPKAEIQVKPKPPVPEVKKPPKEQPKKPDPALKAKEEEKKRKEALRKLQEDLLKDDQPVDHDADKAASEAKAAAEAKRAADALAASSGVVDEYKARIVSKIKRYVNKQLCGTGKPELIFSIAMMPTGEVSGNPQLVKSSGLPACDQAVERAILQAQPLPLPPQPELFSQFRDLNLKFRPNE
jgi:colicin import membrane protein